MTMPLTLTALAVLSVALFLVLMALTAVCIARDCRPRSRPAPSSRRPLNSSGWHQW
ncbi:hypothetical protein KLP28_07390 [Nocardioidaceae bacterium]|nr:hypothetical protein KLP28_07390 [Nocardioidaceae bacterium]